MSGAGDAWILRQQWQQDQQQDSTDDSKYNHDGSGKWNDYHSPPLPTSGFPATATGGGGQFEVHRDRLTQVATQMGAELTRLAGSLTDLETNASGSATIMGWDTADNFATNCSAAFSGISMFHQDLNEAYHLVIGNLRQTVTNYADAELTNSSAAGRVDTGTVLPGGLSGT